METYIQTFHGHKIDFWNPDPDQFDIRDIAHALAVTPRFSGHTSRFYSVAAHSCMVSCLSDEGYKLQGLMHDATEAYLTDMPTPFKRAMPQYAEAEKRIWKAICAKFGLDEELHASVKRADRMCLMKEADALQPHRSDWGPDYEHHERAPKILSVYVDPKKYFLYIYDLHGGP